MKFTSEDLMKAMVLKVGDRVEVEQGTIKATFEVRKDFTLLRLDHTPKYNEDYNLWDILGLEYNILPSPKRVGDLNIDDKYIYYKYKLVPLLDFKSNVCWGNGVPEPKNLYEVLEHWQKYNKDQEIYDLLKARLDMEVKDNEED